MMETLSGIKLMDSFDPQLIVGFDEIWDATFHHKWQPIYKKDLRLQQNYDLYRSSKSSIYEAIESGFEWYRVRISSRFINLFPKSGYFYNEPIPKPTFISKLISIRTNFLISSSNNYFKIEFK